MAERRMISLKIIDTDLFLDMSMSARYLYHELNARADDDGFINSVKKITKMVGASEQDIKELIDRNFLISFKSGIIVIRHWKISNSIQKDRYRPTIYQEEKAMLSTIQTGEYYTVDTLCKQDVSNLDTQVRLGKDRIEVGKDSICTQTVEPDCKSNRKKSQNHKFGGFQHVLLTDEEYNKLINDFGQTLIDDYIKKVDEYCQQYGKSYKDYNLTIRKWIVKDKPESTKRNYEIIPDKEGKIF